MICQVKKCENLASAIKWLQGEGSFVELCSDHADTKILTPHDQHDTAVKEAALREKTRRRSSGVMNKIAGLSMERGSGAKK